jgi:hypothetical protein
MPVAYPTFRAALDAGDLERVLQLAKSMPPMRLEDALRVVLLMRTGDEAKYDRACVRWLGRFAIEVKGVSLKELRDAAQALDELPDQPDTAMAQLQRLCLQRGVSSQR